MGGDNKSPADGKIEKTESKLPKLSRGRHRIRAMRVVPARYFQIQQVALCAKTTGKPGQGAGSAYDPMAGRDNRDRVAAIRGTHRAHGRGMADLARDLTVAAGLAKRDRQQRRPNDPLKLGALEVERNVESLQLPSK
jgi:hypothetical protein